MKRIAQFRSLESVRSVRLFCPFRPSAIAILQCFLHTIPPRSATVGPVTATGPPPLVPVASVEHTSSRVARRKHAELLRRGQGFGPATGGMVGMEKRKRFWKDVHVKKVEEGYQILLDQRPLRTPSTQILTIPHHKPHLASAIALEWDLLASSYQALKQHHIPLTSLVSRALDIAEEDKSTGGEPGEIRTAITETLMRYLDTDSLLCWAPKPPPDPLEYGTNAEGAEDLHNIQVHIAKEIVAFLTARVWPGVEIVPALEGNSIMPVSQPETTRDVIQGWVSGLPAFELAGLEKAVLAGKSLLVAARLLVEWSTELRYLREVKSDRSSRDNGYEKRFGIDEAARAGSLEVTYQTEVWGMVEDTHDVDSEDLRRQLGSVILLVSGEDA